MGTSTEHKVEIVLKEITNALPAFLPELLLAWRNDADVTRFMPSAHVLTWEEHWEWWRTRMNRRDFLIFYDGIRAVGVVHYTFDGEVGILIGEKTLWSRGIGTAALALLLTVLPPQRGMWAAIHSENIASQRVFTKAGFVNTHEPERNGQERWVLK